MEYPFFSTYMLPISLGLIMFGMGLALRWQDFKDILLHPREVITGLVAQMVLLPLFAWLITWPVPLPPPVKVGIVLVAICPGGSTSNLLNYLLKGHLALCVSLTSLNALLTQLTIPLLLQFFLWFYMNTSTSVALPFGEVVIKIFLVTLFPVVAGLMVHHKFPTFAEKARYPLKYLMPILLGIAMLGAAFWEEKTGPSITYKDLAYILPVLLVLNVGSTLLGYYFGRKTGLSKRSAMTIAIEVGLQNTGLALWIATYQLKGDPRIAVPAAVYALFSFFTTAALGLWLSEQKYRIQHLGGHIKAIFGRISKPR